MRANPLQCTVLALQILGLILLSTLFLTINLSERSHRHPLFTNFLFTWVLYSGFTTLGLTAQIALSLDAQQEPGFVLFVGIQSDIIAIMPLVSTMNLVIHLWFAARAANYHEPPRFGNVRIIVLLVTPYLMALFPITVLFDIVPDDVFDFIALAIIIVTSVWDSILVVTFCSSQFFRKAISCGAVPINLIIKLLIFSLFQLTFTALDMSSVILSQAALHGNQLSIQSLAMLDKVGIVAQSFYPLFVFFLFGLQRDILQIWFPCIKRRSDTAVTASMAFSTHISVDLGDLESQHSTERPIERRGSKPDVTDLHRMH